MFQRRRWMVEDRDPSLPTKTCSCKHNPYETLENPHSRNICAAAWALQVGERNHSPAVNPQGIHGMMSFLLKLPTQKQPTPVLHSPYVGRGKARQGTCSVLSKGRKSQISCAGCFIPHITPPCNDLSCTIASSAFMGQWLQGVVTEKEPPKSFSAALVQPTSIWAAHGFPRLKQFPRQHRIFISLRGRRPVNVLGRDKKQCTWLERGRKLITKDHGRNHQWKHKRR